MKTATFAVLAFSLSVLPLFGQDLLISNRTGQTPNYTISTSQNWGNIYVGDNGRINHLAGNVTVAGEVWIGQDVNGSADSLYEISGSATLTTGSLNIGKRVDGGLFPVILHGHFRQDGGAVSANSFGITAGQIDLNGGSLTTARIFREIVFGSGPTINLNGVTLKAPQNNDAEFTFASRINVRNGGVTFDTNGRTYNASAAPLFHSDVAGDAAIDGGLTKVGGGTLILGGNNSYNGGTRLIGGTLHVTGANSLSSGTVTADGGAIGVRGGSPVAIPNRVNVNSALLFDSQANFSLSGEIDLTGGTRSFLQLTPDKSVNLNGPISNGSPHFLAFPGTAPIILGGETSNTYTGTTRVETATVQLDKSSGHAIPGDLEIQNNGTVEYLRSGQIPSTSIVRMNNGNIRAPLNLNLSNPITLAGGTNRFLPTRGDTFNTLTLNGLISGAGTLQMDGAGILVLARSNSYSGGTVLAAGALMVDHEAALGSGTLTVQDGVLASNVGSMHIGNKLNVQGDFFIQPASTGSRTMTFNGEVDLNGQTRTISNIRPGGRVVFSGPINNGTFQNTDSASIEFTNATGNAVLDVAFGSIIANGATFRGLTGSGTVDLAGSMTLNTAGSSHSFTGLVQGAGALAITGSGVQELRNFNNHTGGTRIGGGATVVAISGASLGTGIVTLDGGTLRADALFVRSRNEFKLTNGGGTLDTGSPANTIIIEHPVRLASGTSGGNLTLMGGGRVELTQQNTYYGTTRITDGTRLVALNSGGSATGTGRVIVDGGVLAGAGRIAPQLLEHVTLNSGSISPGDSGPGTLTFAMTSFLSNLTRLQLNGGSLQFELGTISDQVRFATLGDWLRGTGSTLELIPIAGFDPTSTYTIFSNVANAGINNFHFADITGSPAGYTPNFFYDAATTSYKLAFSPALLAGDFNQSGSVDAADYVLWRKGRGATYTENDYGMWQANFGATSYQNVNNATANVPEPGTALLIAAAAIASILVHGRGRVRGADVTCQERSICTMI